LHLFTLSHIPLPSKGEGKALGLPVLTLITGFKNIAPKRPYFIQKLSGTSHVF